MEEVDDYDATINWAEQEENLRLTRTEGVGSFYLVVGSIFVLIICFFALYYGNRGRIDDTEALDMMNDPENIYDDEFSYEDIPVQQEQQEVEVDA